MRELESFTKKYHEEIADFILKNLSNRKLVIAAVGGEGMQAFCKKIKTSNIPVQFFPTADEALPFIQQQFVENSWCLIKGSRGIQLDKLIPLMA